MSYTPEREEPDDEPGLGLGFIPGVAAVIPAAKSIAAAAFKGLLGVVDPGKRRDKEREARAEMWFRLALAGSETAARHLLGGAQFQYTAKERGYYVSRWNAFQGTNATLAMNARTLGPVGIPERDLSSDELAALQDEIDRAHGPGAGLVTLPLPTSPGGAAGGAGGAAGAPGEPGQAGGGSGLLILGALAYLLASGKRGGGRRQ